MAGLSYLTAYSDGTPLKPGVAYADAVSGLHAAFAILAALRHRRTTGQGQHIDLSMRESLTPLLGAAIMDYAMNRRVAKPTGNRHPAMAPHGCYRASGSDRWVAIAVATEEEWRALCGAMGDPPWSRDARFATISNRLKNQDELDRHIEGWTSQHDHIHLMNTLQQAGIKAGAVLDIAELAADPNLNQRGFFEELTHPQAGTHRYPGVSWKMSRTPGRLRLPAPCFGQHNRYVFSELLGMSDEDIMGLKDAGVTAEEPLPYEEI
jgi:benzylsuccinate CoA-transferase BbsF subunit